MSKKKKNLKETPAVNKEPVVAEEENTVDKYIDMYYTAYNNDYISQYLKAYREMKAKEKAAQENEAQKTV